MPYLVASLVFIGILLRILYLNLYAVRIGGRIYLPVRISLLDILADACVLLGLLMFFIYL